MCIHPQPLPQWYGNMGPAEVRPVRRLEWSYPIRRYSAPVLAAASLLWLLLPHWLLVATG